MLQEQQMLFMYIKVDKIVGFIQVEVALNVRSCMVIYDAGVFVLG